MGTANGRRKNSDKNSAPSGPVRDALGRLNGGVPGNSGGKPGRSGRKSIEFIEECERLTDTVALPKIAKYLGRAEPDDPAWRWCVEYVSKYTKSEAPRKVTHGGDETNPVKFTLTIGNTLAA